MKRLNRMLVLAGVAFALCLSTGKVTAQGRGNFDPEQFRQRMMERYREALEIKSDDEWKAIEPLITKVSDARRDVGFGMRGDMFRRRDNNQGDQNQDRRRFGPEPSPAAQDLQKAIESKASAEQIKAKLAAFRADRQQKQANLDKAQENLKKVLTQRQEAVAVMMGLLN